MTLRFQPARLMTPVLFVLFLVALSYRLNPKPWHHLDLLTKLLFAGALLIFVGLMVAMRARSHLRMDERGLEIKYIVGAPRFYAWHDIESARVFNKRILLIPVLSTIRLKLRPNARPSNAARRAASGLVGYDATFLAVYDESPDQIVDQILHNIQIFQRNHGVV